MRWQGGRQSENVEDRRGMRGPMVVSGGLGMLLLVLIVMCLGGDPMALLQQVNRGQRGGQAGPLEPGADRPGAGSRWRSESVCLHCTGRHRGRVARTIQTAGRALPGAAVGAVLGTNAISVRICQRGGRSVLLPGRLQGVSGYGVLPGAGREISSVGRFCAGIRRRA